MTSFGLGNSSAPWDKPTVFHNGIDYLAEPRSEVRAILDGTVTATRNRSIGGVVTIWHPQIGRVTEYGHVEDIEVEPGDSVRRGQRVAVIWPGSDLSGWTPHLHLKMCRATCDEFTLGLEDPATIEMTCDHDRNAVALYPVGCGQEIETR